MAMNRRGVFLSLTAVLVIGILLVALQAPVPRSDREIIHLQVQHAARDIERLETSNLPQILATKSREALNRLGSHAATIPYPSVDAAQAAFSACMTGANCEGTWSSPVNETLHRIETLYHEELQYELDVELIDARLTQVGPFELLVEGTFTIRLLDPANEVAITRTETVPARFSIEGLVEPTRSAALGAPARITRERRTLVGADMLLTHAAAGTYLANQEAPSYLQRLAGGGTSEFGIHSTLPAGTRGTQSHIDFLPAVAGCLYRVPSGGADLYIPERYVTVYDLDLRAGDAQLVGTSC